VKKLLIIPALILSFNVNAGSLGDFTNTLVQSKQDMIVCDTLTSCTEVSMTYYTFINHPDNQKDLLRCEKNGKCYEAMMDVTMFMFTDFLPKLGTL
jgi:hypothetical protein